MIAYILSSFFQLKFWLTEAFFCHQKSNKFGLSLSGSSDVVPHQQQTMDD